MTDTALLQDFLTDQAELTRRSPMTVYQSRRVTTRFLVFLTQHQLTLTQAHQQGQLARLAVQWLQGIRAAGAKSESLHTYLGKLNAFLDYAVACRQLPENPMRNARLQRQRIGRTRVLTVPEVERLLLQPDRATPKGLRDWALLTFLYATGARPSEVAAAERADLTDDLFHLRHGKKSRQRLIPLVENGLHSLRRYLSQRRDDHPALFVGARGRPLSASHITRLVRHYADQAGLESDSAEGGQVTAMTLRHCYGSHLIEAGMEPELVARLMGHSSLQETSVYVHVTLEDQRRELEKLPPFFEVDWGPAQAVIEAEKKKRQKKKDRQQKRQRKNPPKPQRKT